MPKRKEKALSALEVSRLDAPGNYFIGKPAGFVLQITKTGAKSWALRYMLRGVRREFGLGSCKDFTLAEATARAKEARDLIGRGIDPVIERQASISEQAAAAASAVTFKQAAEAFIKAKSAEWSNAKHASQWSNTLETYAYPFIEKIHVQDVTLSHIVRILDPIWLTKTETATRVRGRIESVLDWATVHGHRKGDNPARWRGHLDKILAKPSKVTDVAHHAALPYAEAGAFMDELRRQAGSGAKALEFAILTAARSGEVRGATWAEIDLDASLWVIPAERMKAGKEHRVPLSVEAIRLLESLPKSDKTPLVFASTKGTMLSDMTVTAVLRRMGRKVTAHGFRSTFRDWAGETTAYPREVIEHALAHQLKDKAEAAYARGTLFDKRKKLMRDWGRFCGQAQEDAKVIPMKGKVAA